MSNINKILLPLLLLCFCGLISYHFYLLAAITYQMAKTSPGFHGSRYVLSVATPRS